MPRDYVLWYNPRCSSCQRALALLREKGIEPELRRYLEEPPTAAELEDLLRRLGLPAHAVARTKEDEYQVLRLSERTPHDGLVQAFVHHPRILERPILVHGDRAVVARPPERVLELVPIAPAPPA